MKFNGYFQQQRLTFNTFNSFNEIQYANPLFLPFIKKRYSFKLSYYFYRKHLDHDEKNIGGSIYYWN